MKSAYEEDWRYLVSAGFLKPSAVSMDDFCKSMVRAVDEAVQRHWFTEAPGLLCPDPETLKALHAFIATRALESARQPKSQWCGVFRSETAIEPEDKSEPDGSEPEPKKTVEEERLEKLSAFLHTALFESPAADPALQDATPDFLRQFSEPIARWHAGFHEIKPFPFGNEAVGMAVLQSQLNALQGPHVYPTLIEADYAQAAGRPLGERLGALLETNLQAHLNALQVHRTQDPEMGPLSALMSGIVNRGSASDFKALYVHALVHQVAPGDFWGAFNAVHFRSKGHESAAAIRENLAKLYKSDGLTDIDNPRERALNTVAREWLGLLASEQQVSPQMSLEEKLQNDRRMSLTYNY